MADSSRDNQGADPVAVLLSLEGGVVRIHLSGEGEPARGAVIRPGSGAILHLNGKKVDGEAEVFPGDEVSLAPEEQVDSDRLEVRVSADRLTAEARWLPGVKKSYQFKDSPPAAVLQVETLPLREEYRSLTAADLEGAIRAQRVSFGLDRSQYEAVFAAKSQWVVIARGLPVKEGRHGYVEQLFEGASKTVSYGEGLGRVDFRDRFVIEQVSEGEAIANIHPPEPGSPGRAVTGEDLPPEKVEKAAVSCESGTCFSADGRQILAATKGVPSAKRGNTVTFRVDDVYVHRGDVDIKSGNIDFHGHFRVQGAVTEGMRVAAGGNIEIDENASGAEILAGGSVVFKRNCIRCQVQAGWLDMVQEEIYGALNAVSKDIEQLLEAADEVVRALEARQQYNEKMETTVLRALLQGKYASLPEKCLKLQENLKKAGRSLPAELVYLVREVTPPLVNYQYDQSLSRTWLGEAVRKLKVTQDSRVRPPGGADITAPYIQNSVLSCTGDIIVTGQGVYNSQLRSQGQVRIDRLFRGGVIASGGDVIIGEAGTERVTTEQGRIEVTSESAVCLGIGHENLFIKFGSIGYRCPDKMVRVRLVLDREEMIVKSLPWND